MKKIALTFVCLLSLNAAFAKVSCSATSASGDWKVTVTCDSCDACAMAKKIAAVL